MEGHMKCTRKGLLIINAILIICTMLIRTKYMLDAFYVALIPIVISSIIIWRQNEIELRINKRYLVVALVLSLIFILMLSVEQVLKMIIQMDNELNHLIFKVLFLPVLFFNIFISIYYLLYKSNNLKLGDMVSCNDNAGDFKSFFIYKPTWIIR